MKRTKYDTLAHCEGCPLEHPTNLAGYYVPTHIPQVQQLNVLFIGRNPGQTERLTGQPFTGGAGKMHWRLLSSVGLRRDLMPHTNVVSCTTNRDSSKRDECPNQATKSRCKPRLIALIKKLKPSLIIALGDDAMAATTTRKSQVLKAAGSFFDLLPEFDHVCRVLVLPHPSFVMTQRQWIPLTTKMYQQIPDFFTRGEATSAKPTFYADPTPEELEAYLYSIPEVPSNIPQWQRRFYLTTACDTETTGLHKRKDHIIGYSFSKDPSSAMCVDLNGAGLLPDPRLPVIEKWMSDPSQFKCWQNGSYDLAMMNTCSMPHAGFAYDTRLGQQMLYSDLPSDLDHLRNQYTNIPPYKPPRSKMKQIVNWGSAERQEYANWDAVTTKVVMLEQLRKMGELQVQLLDNLLIPLVFALERIERRGVLVNQKLLSLKALEIQPRLEELEKPWAEKGINPRSPKQLCSYLGVKSTNEKILTQLVKQNRHPKVKEIEQLLQHRKTQKMFSNYLVGIYRRLEDGRIHTTYKIEGTGTGRLASGDPNLQNQTGWSKPIFVADPGHLLLIADYKQIELWVGAILAHEDRMLDDLMSGKDIHFEACCIIWPKDLTYGDKRDYTHRERQVAKTVVFGTFYGRGARSIALEFGASVAEAQVWQQRLINKYPNLLVYKTNCEKEFHSCGYLTTPFGRKRYVQSITQGYNFPVQSTAADVMLQSIVLSDQANLLPWATVYDELVTMIPTTTWEQDALATRKILERPIPQLENVGFRCDYTYGSHWGAKEEVRWEKLKQE